MSAESLSLIAGTVLSLAFSYIPGLNAKFAVLSSTAKRLVLLALLALSAGAVYGLSCLGWGAAWGIALVCDQAGLQSLLENLLLAVIASQGVYSISPEVRSVAAAKAAR